MSSHNLCIGIHPGNHVTPVPPLWIGIHPGSYLWSRYSNRNMWPLTCCLSLSFPFPDSLLGYHFLNYPSIGSSGNHFRVPTPMMSHSPRVPSPLPTHTHKSHRISTYFQKIHLTGLGSPPVHSGHPNKS